MVAVALAVRLIPVLRGGGLFGTMAYDDGVYFGSAIALLDGRVPYRDFLLLHPPGILVVLAPFAALGHLVGDPAGFAAARLAFMVLGAVNVVLVTLVASRAGRRAALAAGALYVVWEVAANVERTTWLVAPQSTLLLLALLGLAGPRGRPAAWVPSLRRCAVAGVLLGLNVGLQVWGVVPLAIVLGWLVAIHRRSLRAAVRPVLATVIGAAVAIAAVWGPFLLVAGPQMVRYVLLDQAGRTLAHASIVERMRYMEGLPLHHGLGPWVPSFLVIGAFVVAAAAVAWVARRRPVVRLWAAILAAQVGALFLAPPLAHYAGWLAPAAALVAGCVVDTALEAASSRRRITARSDWGSRPASRSCSSHRRSGRRQPALARTARRGARGRAVRDRRLADAPDRDRGARARPAARLPADARSDRRQLRRRPVDPVPRRADRLPGRDGGVLRHQRRRAVRPARPDAFPASTLAAIRRRLPTDGVLGSVTVMIDGGD